ncbi:glycosyltransferase family 2 protein [Ureibacillus sinduriensis]|uniref:Glycosyl transferase n=1 Tax=Ureibacillus sinduriensis BLB-1 = JCM 15800 TaxID=1384057 RepID=A0A0A3HTK2_9BACL|nr:glycosyltransferase family 2 protein [Ureibacillus sinduriensis]KGR75754.1 glycosyl transferase [Ureibacillus sinduriensis BLB-1 = JCM 15800]
MKKREEGLVSFVIPCYNASLYIEDCLNGLLSQTYKNLEVILVNDGSTDNTEQIIEQWIENSDPPFPVILCNLPVNTGFAGALTTGYFMSSGEYIALNDADDISHPSRVEKQVEFLLNNPEYSLVGTNYRSFSDGDKESGKEANWLHYGEEIRKIYALGKHCVCHGTILFHGKCFDLLGGPTRRIKGAEDYEFIVKFLNAKLKIENLKDVLYYYRLHDKQRSKMFYGSGEK